MIKKQISYDHGPITGLAQIHVRQITRIIEDGKEISTIYHRHVLNPGDDLKEQDERSKQIAQAIWTPKVIAAYKAKIEKTKS